MADAKKPAKPAAKPRTRRPANEKVPDPVDPWDRQPDETGPSYDGFLTYRDLGITRSLAKVAQESGKHRSLIERWSSRHHWPLRAAAWDREQDRAYQLALIQERKKAAKRNARIAAAALQKAANGIVALSPHTMSASDIARLLAAASNLERLALGEPTANVQVAGPGGGPVKVETDMTLLTDEERVERMKQLRDEIDRRLGADAGEAKA